jgi:hypothetical protein
VPPFRRQLRDGATLGVAGNLTGDVIRVTVKAAPVTASK